MAFFISNNFKLALNSHIGYRLTHNAHKISFIKSKPVYSELNTSFSQINKYFVGNHMDSLCCRPNLKGQRTSKLERIPVNQFYSVFPVTNHLLFKPTNKLSYSTVLDKSTNFIISFRNSENVSNQIRFFHTPRHNNREKNKGLYNKIKTFFGLNETNSNNKVYERTDLENYYNTFSTEKLGSDQNQEQLLAFVEGYKLSEKSNISINVETSWDQYCYLAGVLLPILLVDFLILLFKTADETKTTDETKTPEAIKSEIKFDNVKGAETAKQELKNIVEYLKNPERFSALGGKLPKGVLLVGRPGTGKTLLAKAVAGEAGVTFFSASGSEFDEQYVGVGSKRIRDLFNLARDNAPCIIFIDEIDSVGRERVDSSVDSHVNDTVNQLLTEMDGFRNNSGVIVLGATNRKEDLDKALLRPGRFDVEVTVLVPNFSERKELLDYYLGQVRHYNINTEILARGTTNFTGADIENMVNQAALRAAVIGAPYVTMEHLEYARDKAIMGPEQAYKITDKETNRITAYHEAGHTVVSYFTEKSQPLHKVTIIGRGYSLGQTSYIPDKDMYHITKEQALAMIDSAMGGRAAEELVFGSEKITTGSANDLQKATELASIMVKKWGMSNTIGLSTYNSHTLSSQQTADLIDMEITKILQESYERAKTILIAHKDKHIQLSEALLKHETLNADEISAILKGNELPTKG